MKLAIIEDNETEAKILKEKTIQLIPQSFGPTTIDVYYSAQQYLKTKLFYDLLLIDCLLPDMSGVELAKYIRQTNQITAFIFTTAYMDYAVEGYEANAMRYLLKPIQDEKLKEALESFSKQAEPDPIIELTGTTRYATYTKTSDIIYIEFVGRKIIAILNDQSVESRKSMKQFETELSPEFFFRTSPRYLVNFSHIISKKNNILIMYNGDQVTISGRKLMAFNHAYIQFLKRS